MKEITLTCVIPARSGEGSSVEVSKCMFPATLSKKALFVDHTLPHD